MYKKPYDLGLTTVKAKKPLPLPNVIGWHNWGDYFNILDVWLPVVEDICDELNLAGECSCRMGYPGTCAVLIVQDEFIVKIYPPMLPDDFAKEHVLYAYLNSRTDYIPAMFASGVYEEDRDWYFLILQYSNSTPIREIFSSLSTENKLEIARDMGMFLRLVHSCPISDSMPFLPWRSFLKQRVENCLFEVANRLPLSESLHNQINDLINDMVPSLIDLDPVILNADLTDDHILLKESDGLWHLDKIIDWADAVIAPREYEWVAAWFGFCQKEPEMFLELLKGYDPFWQPDNDFKQRMFLFTLLHRFGSFIIAEQWHLDGKPEIDSISKMMDWLWF